MRNVVVGAIGFEPVLAANLSYTLDLDFDKPRLEKLIAEFESSAKRTIDRSLALKLRNELLGSEPPYISRPTIGHLGQMVQNEQPYVLGWDGRGSQNQ
jgi:hypothetical protein